MKLPDPLIIERPLKGLIPSYSSVTPSTSIEGPEGTYTPIGNGVSLFRPNKVGHIAPSEVFDTLTDAGSRVTGIPINATVASTNEAFALLAVAANRVVRWGTGDNVIDANYDVDFASGTHNGHTGSAAGLGDIFSFTDGIGVECIISSFSDSVDADIMFITAAGGSQSSVWFSGATGGSVLTKNVPIKFTIGTNRKIYGTHGQYILSIAVTGDATNAANVTVDKQALNLGAGWTARSITTLGDYIAIVADNGTQGMLFLWLPYYNSTFPTYAYPINDRSVPCVFNDGGELTLFSYGRNGTFKKQVLRSSGVEVVYESALIGSPPNHGGVDSYQGMMNFVTSNGSLMQWNGGMHRRTQAIFGQSFCKNLATENLYVGTSSTIKVLNSAKFAPSSVSGFRSRIRVMPYKATIKAFKFRFSQFGSGAKFNFQVKKNNATATSLDVSIDQSLIGSLVSYRLPCQITDVNQFGYEITFTHSNATDVAAIISDIEVEYEPSSKV